MTLWTDLKTEKLKPLKLFKAILQNRHFKYVMILVCESLNLLLKNKDRNVPSFRLFLCTVPCFSLSLSFSLTFFLPHSCTRNWNVTCIPLLVCASLVQLSVCPVVHLTKEKVKNTSCRAKATHT